MHLGIPHEQTPTVGATTSCECETRIEDIADPTDIRNREIQLLAAMVFAEANPGQATDVEQRAIAWVAMNRYRYLKYLSCVPGFYEKNVETYVLRYRESVGSGVEWTDADDGQVTTYQVPQLTGYYDGQRTSMQSLGFPTPRNPDDPEGVSLIWVLLANDFQNSPKHAPSYGWINETERARYTNPDQYGWAYVPSGEGTGSYDDVLSFDATGPYLDPDEICHIDPDLCASITSAIEVAIEVYDASKALENSPDDPMRWYAGLGVGDPGAPLGAQSTTTGSDPVEQARVFPQLISFNHDGSGMAYDYSELAWTFDTDTSDGTGSFRVGEYYRYGGPFDYVLRPVASVSYPVTTFVRFTIDNFVEGQIGLIQLTLFRFELMKADAYCLPPEDEASSGDGS